MNYHYKYYGWDRHSSSWNDAFTCNVGGWTKGGLNCENRHESDSRVSGGLHFLTLDIWLDCADNCQTQDMDCAFKCDWN